MDKLLEDLTGDDLADWLAYAEVEPFGEWWDDCKTNYLINLQVKKPKPPGELFPSLRRSRKEIEEDYWASPEGQNVIAKMYAAAFSRFPRHGETECK